MKIQKADLWDLHSQGEWIGITTNGFVKKNGCAVMGRGCALQASRRYPLLPADLGAHLSTFGNVPTLYYRTRLITFPVKHNWWEHADLDLIEESALRLSTLLEASGLTRVFLPKPGCGNGKLTWEQVEPIFDHINDPRIKIVDNTDL